MVNNDVGNPQEIREALDQLCLWIVDLAVKGKDDRPSIR